MPTGNLDGKFDDVGGVSKINTNYLTLFIDDQFIKKVTNK
jgi:hypothetical protein